MRFIGFFSPLATQTLGAFMIKGLGVVLALASSVFLARLLGPAELGAYAFCLGIVQVLSVPGSLGLQQLLVREVASGMADNRWGRIRGLLHRGKQGALVISLFLSGSMLLAGLVRGGEGQNSNVFFWAAAFLPFLTLFQINASTLRGLGHVVLGDFSELTIRPGLFLVFIAAAYFFVPLAFSASTAMAMQTLAGGLACVFSFWGLSRGLPEKVRTASPIYEERAWFRSAMAFMFLNGLSILNNNLAVLVLGSFHMQSESGLFLVAYRGAEVILFSILAVGSAVAPRLSNLYAQGRTEELQGLIAKSSIYIMVYSVSVAAVFIVFAEPIINFLFGSKYLPAVKPFRILCVAQMLNATFGYAGLALNMIGKEGLTMSCMAFGFGANLILNLLLVPGYGVVGAAIANAAGIVIWKFLAAMLLDRRLSIRTGPFLVRKWLE